MPLFNPLVGNDARKAISDGYPLQNVVTSDIEKRA